MSSSNVIVTRNLTKRYGKFTAVDGLNLSVREGEVFGLLGPNGAGKTTTILMLLGMTEPTSGSATVAGADPARESLVVKSLVGYLPDNVGFYPTLTGRQNLRYTAGLNGMRGPEVEERITQLLGQVGLEEAADKRAGSYSRGMRQRLAIADALVKRPRILILDEPTIGIDPEGVRELLLLLRRLKEEQGMTILLSSHLLHQVQEICDRVGIFVGGRLIAAGPVAELEQKLSLGGGQEIELRVATSDGAPVLFTQKMVDEVKAGRVHDDDASPEPSDPAHRVARELAGLKGVERLSVSHGMLILHCGRDVRVEVARLIGALGMLVVHLRIRGLTLDEIYDRYFQEGGEVNRVVA